MLFQLILKNIQKNKFIAILSIFILFIVIFFSSFLNFIYENTQHILINENIWQDNKKFVITTKRWDLLSSTLWIKPNLIKYYNKLKNDKNIEKVFWLYQVNIPTTAILSILNLSFKTDILVFASDKYQQKWKDIDIWISPTLLNLYNTQVANDTLPTLTKNLLSKLNIHLIFWENSFFKYNKIIENNWHINFIDKDVPLFWITIPYDTAKQIQKNLWKWDIHLIKIIWYVKNYSYLKVLKKNYKSLNIKTLDDVKIKINQQTKIVNDIFNVLKYIIYIITISFLILLALYIYHKNQKNINVFYYHWASFIQQFSIVFLEIIIYFLIAIILNFLIIWIFNTNIINFINQRISEYWFYEIQINWISFINMLENALESLFIIIIVFLSVFVVKRK